MVSRSVLEVRYAETDQMGVVHHGAYVPWLEVGRVHWLRAAGVEYAELEREGLFFPVVELELRYRRALRFGQEVEVRTRLAELASRRLVFAYEVAPLGGGLAAAGQSVHVPQDASGRVRRLPEALYDLLQSLLEPHT